MQQPISSSVSHTYTHATLSIVETTVRSTYGVAPAAFTPSGPGSSKATAVPPAHSASVHDGATYTPGSSLHQALEDAVAPPSTPPPSVTPASPAVFVMQAPASSPILPRAAPAEPSSRPPTKVSTPSSTSSPRQTLLRRLALLR